MSNFWDDRYSEEGFAYGEEPNDFLRENVNLFKPSSEILCIAEGEGRNAIFLAQNGFNVTAVDQSEVGIKKTLERAKTKGVTINALTANLEEFEFGDKKWDGIVSIFGHLPPQLRRKVHLKIMSSLKDGGIYLCEAYTMAQLKHNTGGPKDPEMMLSEDILSEELKSLNITKNVETTRNIHEGKYHTGLSAVVQFIGKK